MAISPANTTDRGKTTRRRAGLLLVAACLAVLTSAPLWSPGHAAASPTLADSTLSNPDLSGAAYALTVGRLGDTGDASAFLYYQSWGSHPWAAFRDRSTGAISNVSLSPTSVQMSEWSAATAVFTPGWLYVLSGTGPVYVRAFQLSGSPLPTSASLARTWTLGDGDSRPGDLIRLRSGALAAFWHQQGSTGPQGYGVGYLASPTASAWSTTYPVQFMPSAASKQVAVQHPADGSVWMFSDPDAFGRIGAMHLTERSGGLAVDWTDPYYLEPGMGAAAPDQENPWLAAAPDPGTGTIALAYQSGDRKVFSTSPVVIGSKPVITRIGTNGVTSTTVLPVYVERVSSIGLVVRGSATWLAYRPIDESTLQSSDLYASMHDGTAWQPATRLGTLASPSERVQYAVDGVELVAPMADGRFHYFTEGSTTSPTSSTTTSSTTTSSTTSTTAPAGSTRTCKAKHCR